jgi:PAS domain S-box-containing protein
VSSTSAEGNNKKILIVEDSVTQAMVLQHLLEENGYSVVKAVSGKDALKAIAAERPALIISDIIMPEMDGFELTRRIKDNQDLVDIPVILLTALSDSEDVIRGLETDVDFYLTKPYDDKFLLSKVQSVIAVDSKNKASKERRELQVNLWGSARNVIVDPEQAVSFLASTYENAVQINRQLQKEIAERKRVEEELRHTLKRLEEMETIIEISPAVAFVRRATGNWPIEFISENVLQFDYESEDILSGEIEYGEIIHPDDRQRVFAEVARYSNDTEVEEYRQEYRILTGYGETKWVDERTCFHRNSKGVITHLRGIIVDVTHRMNTDFNQNREETTRSKQ